MQTINSPKKILGWFFIVLFLPPFLGAQDIRTIPLDMYLIVDGSSQTPGAKNETAAWIGEQIIDRILKDGDSLTLWSAGPKAQVLFSGILGGANGKDAAKAKLSALDASGGVPDFAGAIRDAATAAVRGSSGRIPYTLLVSASAGALAPALTGRDANLFRWSRVEEYSRFRVLVVAPDIQARVRQAAAAYMAYITGI
jgi:hypothetical protein